MQAQGPIDGRNVDGKLIYINDLPPTETTSVKIAEKVKAMTDYEIKQGYKP